MFNQATKNFCSQIKIRLPIIQAPMAGGIVTPALIAAVNQSGGLGSLPLGYLSIDEARESIRKTSAVTSGEFAVNVFIPTPQNHLNQKQVEQMLAYINACRAQSGLTAYSEIPAWIEPDIDDLLDIIISEGVSVITLTFGILNKQRMATLHQKGVFVMGTATTVREGLAIEAAGCDAVIAQGYEAGGHRGGDFLEDYSGGLIGTMALIPQMADAVSIPVIAAGGIMDGRGITAALALGASAVQLGTAFLTCDESAASSMHKNTVMENTEESTCITRAFTGKPVRAFKNQFITTTEKKFTNDELLPYPFQHQLTKELRREANKSGNPQCAGLWSGQGTRLSREISVASLMDKLEKEVVSAISHF